jgi:hypothetical protein
MYSYQGAQSGGAAQAVCVFVGLLLVGAVVAGVFLGGSELLSPSVHEAEANKLKAEADAIRTQTAYEERQRQIALDLAEQKAATELQTLQARRAKQLELMEPLTIVGTVVGSLVVLTLTVTISYYFITKARAVQGPVLERAQLAQHNVVPSSPQQGQGRDSGDGQPACLIDRAKVRPDDVTYDGFLAYFRDYILHPNRTRAFYHAGVAPEIEDVYLAILTEAQIISWGTNGHSGWILPREIRGVEDVKRRISRCAFYSLASSCRTFSTVESLLFPDMDLQQEPSRAFSNS